MCVYQMYTQKLTHRQMRLISKLIYYIQQNYNDIVNEQIQCPRWMYSKRLLMGKHGILLKWYV